jgi:hypothetical protein
MNPRDLPTDIDPRKAMPIAFAAGAATMGAALALALVVLRLAGVH